MKINKKYSILIFALIFALFISLSAVSASEISDSDDGDILATNIDGNLGLNPTDAVSAEDSPTANITVVSEYTSVPTVYAGVSNNLTITVKNTGKSVENVTVSVLLGSQELGTLNIANYENNKSYKFNVIDSTVRDVNASTVEGNHNIKINYTVVVKDNAGTLINKTNSTFVLLYNGYLGKYYEYPQANPTLRNFTITGNVIVLNTKNYSAGSATNRTDTFDIALNGDVSQALLYVAYNWDKSPDDDFESWNTTFNGQVIAPIASYRDQGNMGKYGTYGYGLVVYNVTSFVVDGANTFEFNKTKGISAVYPSNLIVLVDNVPDGSKKTVYLYEEADLLSKDYNKNLDAEFRTDFDTVDGSATLYVFAAGAQAGEGNIVLDGVTYEDVWSGTTQSFDTFITDINSGSSYVYFEATGGTILGLHQMIVVDDIFTFDADVSSEYTSIPSVYAGVNNTITVVVTNKGKSADNINVSLFVEGNKIGSEVIASMNNYDSKTLTFVDTTIRPITANTVIGNNNVNANYTVVIKDSNGNLIDTFDFTPVILYNGNLGKDFEYPNANPLIREFYISGDVIVLSTKDYSAGSATSRTDVFNVLVEDEDDIDSALLYVAYNWDKTIDGDFNSWNTTFNGEIITPIADYRDQGNLGKYGAYGYGLVVYDVSDLVVAGNNTFEINKTKGNAAVYPSNLIVLTNNESSDIKKSVYIYEEADLLSKTYNKNLEAGFTTTFDASAGNATLYVFAASAQAGEGNLIINGVTKSDVWSGTSNSFDTYTTALDSGYIDIFFEATGGTILGLHQMVVVQEEMINVSAVVTSEYNNGKGAYHTVYAGVNNTITVVVSNNGNATDNVTVRLYADGYEIGSELITKLLNTTNVTLTFVDDTFRPITENTVEGNNNENVSYVVVIEDADGLVVKTIEFNPVLLYNGNLGKEYEYPNAEPLIREFYISGDVIVLSTKDYSAGSATNRTDVFNILVEDDDDITYALLYISYNWDKDPAGDFNSWNVTFNGITITPIDSYRDQGNMGQYGTYGYGLVVYDVSDFAVAGNNTLVINKNKGMAAVYPSNLIVLTDNVTSGVKKSVYIYEEADLLSKTYNKNLEAGFTTTFDASAGNATLYVFAASAQAGDGNLIINGVNKSDVWSGTSNSFDTYTTALDSGYIDVFFEATGGTILGLHQMVVVQEEMINVSAVVTSEYNNGKGAYHTVYAGVENTITVVVSNHGKETENVTVTLFAGIDNEIGTQLIPILSNTTNATLTFVDPFIRPITEFTVEGNDNDNVTYYVFIQDADGLVVDYIEFNPVLLYNGYLGKEYEYPNAEPLIRQFYISGNVIVLSTKDYSAGSATNRTDVFNVVVEDDENISFALLYVSYNWDKNPAGDFNSWNVTFNGQTITPIDSYRDQGNMGQYGTYGYGLVVYDVSDLVVAGNNTFAFNKTKGNAAIYPSNLIVLTNNDDSATYKTVYIYEEADLLSKTYNKNLEAGFTTTFDASAGNATLYVFAASAQAGDGNLIINGVNKSDVWSGTANSFDTYTTALDSGYIDVFFEATGGTILGLHQMVVVESENIFIYAPDLTKYKGSADRFVVNVTNLAGDPIVNQTVVINLNGVPYTRVTDENGIAGMNINLNPGEYTATVTAGSASVNSTITVLTTVNGTNITKIFKNGTQYYATFLDTNGNYLANGTEVTFNINGVMYQRKVSGDKGLARLNINLNPGEYILTAINPNSSEMSSNLITVLAQITENNDLVKYFRNDSQYRVKVLDKEGKAVGANETVVFNINGVMYQRLTDAEGYAKLNINLDPGHYVITAMYGDSMVSNNITVKPILTANDLVKKFGTPDQFKANLVDGQGNPYAGQNVTFNINGVMYNRETDGNGTAALNINLMPGEYIITSSYGAASTGNTVTVLYK